MTRTDTHAPLSQDALARLAGVIESRKPVNGGDPDKSYVARLLHKGPDAFLKKVGEEATEVVIAGKERIAVWFKRFLPLPLYTAFARRLKVH